MAEFSEVMRQWKRMCMTYIGDEECSTFCPLNDVWCPAEDAPIADIQKFVNAMSIDEMERAVRRWAAEHPEPITWGDWFVEQDMLFGGYQNATSDAWMAARFREIMHTPIPADIAHKLGIRPKEDGRIMEMVCDRCGRPTGEWRERAKEGNE